ncbi:MAG: hypothetical protein ACOYEV_17615 [Candidatus Nanopelagicales bacterium]
MATRIKPLMTSAVALASAAAIAVASPAIAPNLAAPTTNALSKAAYELTTFSDVFTIPPAELTGILFYQQSWGNVVGPGAADFPVEPYDTMCDFNCTSTGISGAAYLILDALINGNGAGFDNVAGILQDPSKPYQPDPNLPNYNPYTTQPWGTSVVNYFFEPQYSDVLGTGSIFGVQQVFAGISASLDYILSATVGQAFPASQPLIETIFYGEDNVTRIWRAGWTLAAFALEGLPIVGAAAANSIFAYLGALPAPNSTADNPIAYQEGLSGVLEFWVDVANGSQNPFAPYPPVQAAAAAGAARGAAALATATSAVSRSAESAATTVAATVAGATSAGAPTESIAAQSSVSASTAPAADSTATTPTAADSTATAPTVTSTDVKPADTTSTTPSSSTVTAATESSAAASSATSPATTSAPVKTRKRPVRDAVAGAAKAVTSAVSGAAKAATGGASASN